MTEDRYERGRARLREIHGIRSLRTIEGSAADADAEG
jgi:hypothetical protein